MALDEQAIKYQSMDDWFTTPQGRRVAEAFSSELSHINEQLNGETLLQLGNCGENLWLPPLHFRHKWLVTPDFDMTKSSLVASIQALPITRDSIDCVIAPLCLELFSQDKSPLDEIDRILKPMGYCVFFGINPWSFWGAALRLGQLACFDRSKITLTSSFSIKNSMLHRGYRQCFHSSFYYILPVKNEKLIHKLEFFNEMGKMIWPFPAGFYCLIMQKYQPCAPSLLADVTDEKLLLRPSVTPYSR